MAGDLPDYHEYVVEAPDIVVPDARPYDVAEYDSAPADIPDGDRAPLLIDIKGRLYVVQHEKDRTISSGQISVRPTGGVLEKGSVASAAAYATVASRVVTDGKEFQLSKIVVSAVKAAWVKYRWDASDISCERLLDDKTILIEHFPWDYYEMEGDGAKAFDVQTKYETASGTVNVEIVGEEV